MARRPPTTHLHVQGRDAPEFALVARQHGKIGGERRRRDEEIVGADDGSNLTKYHLLTLNRRLMRKIEKSLKQAMHELKGEEYDTADEMHAALKKKDPLIGTPAAALTAYRFRLNLTQKELSKKTGIPQPHISDMEKGKRPIGLVSAKKIARALKIDYHKLV